LGQDCGCQLDRKQQMDPGGDTRVGLDLSA